MSVLGSIEERPPEGGPKYVQEDVHDEPRPWDDPEEPWMLLDLAWLFPPEQPAHRHLTALADAWEELPADLRGEVGDAFSGLLREFRGN